MVDVSVKILPHGVGLPLPKYQTEFSAGLDLFAALEEELEVPYMQPILIPAGIAIAIPSGYEAQIRSRSGLAAKNSVIVLNSPGTIDADYRGEIKVCLMNFSKQSFIVTRGMRIAQLILAKLEGLNWVLKEELDSSKRNESGFGSTGK